MTKIKYLLVFFACMLAFPLTSLADCSYERQAELSRIASNVRFSYTYDFENDGVVFYVDVANLTNDIYIIDDKFDNYIIGSGDKTIKYNTDGVTVVYNIYSADNNCYGNKILTNSIKFPSYNLYSQYYECRNNSNFKFCQIWANTKSISDDEFWREFNKYQSSKKTTINDTEKSNNGFVDWLSTDYNLFQCLISLILLIALIIYFAVKKVKK